GYSRLGTSLAPPHPGPIVGADACGLGDFGLHPTPRGRHIPPAGFDHHSRAASPRAVDVETITAHVDQLTRWGIGPHIGGFRRRFVDRPNHSEDDDQSDYRGQPAA